MKFPWVTDHVKSKANKEMKKCAILCKKNCIYMTVLSRPRCMITKDILIVTYNFHYLTLSDMTT